MAKALAEYSNRLSIFWLKKNHYLPSKQNTESIQLGGIRWGKNSIRFVIATNLRDTTGEEDYIELQYTNTNRWSGEKENMDYKVRLTTTPCRYGGVRYWFICPFTTNGQYCGRRVGVLYSIGKWFGCRKCGNIAYASQMRGGAFRGTSIALPDIERAEEEIKRYYYNSNPTRKYRRVMKMNDKLNRDFIIGLASKLDRKQGKLAKFANLLK